MNATASSWPNSRSTTLNVPEIALYGPRGVVGTLPRLDATNAAIVALEKLANGRLVTRSEPTAG